MVNLNLEADAALYRHAFEKIDDKTRRADDRPAHKNGIGRFAVAKMPDDRLRLQEIAVGTRRERRRLRRRVGRHHHLTRRRRAGRRARSRSNRVALALQGFGDLEGELDGLAGVETRVAMRQVVGGETLLADLLRAADAFGDVLAG